MFLIHGTARALSARKSDLARAAHEMAEATRGDDGCLFYEFSASLTDDTIIGTEIWRDQAALDAHMAHGHTAEFFAALEGVLDGEPVMQKIPLI